MELKRLMADYNKRLARYRKMEAWEGNASHDDQIKFEQQIIQAIDDCSLALNRVQALRPVTMDEVINGFAI